MSLLSSTSLRFAAASGLVAERPAMMASRRCVSSMSMMQQKASDVRKMRSTEIIMDRYQPEVYNDNLSLSLLSAGGRAQKRFQFGSMTKSFRAKSLVTRRDKGFNERGFIAEAQLIFQEFNAALATNNLGSLGDVATEHLLGRLQKHMEYEPLVGTHNLSRIASFLEPPQVLQARTVQVHQTANDLVFAQFTVRFVTENRRVGAEDVVGLRSSSHRSSKSRTKSIKKNDPFAVSRQMNTGASRLEREPGRWQVAFDEKGEYYYNTVTKESRWERPPNFLVSPSYTMCSRGTLGATGVVLEEDGETGQDKVQLDVVFERPLFNLATPWRVAFF
mmetsp:Transcript_12881/g.24997  ORF Transcript_12881/g.24997 Transcript_12881/m.24997 type:complete len:332 (+) Transcript_12881:97-1092(+)